MCDSITEALFCIDFDFDCFDFEFPNKTTQHDCNKFKIASDIDSEYGKVITKAVKKNLNILCYDCKISPKGIKLNREIKLEM